MGPCEAAIKVKVNLKFLVFRGRHMSKRILAIMKVVRKVTAHKVKVDDCKNTLLTLGLSYSLTRGKHFNELGWNDLDGLLGKDWVAS